jgi:hypothetical protein
MSGGKSITDSGRRKSRAGALASLMLLLASGHAGRGAVQTPSEYQVKAAFLLNFTKFVNWPDAAFASPEMPISICILGEDPFGPELDKIIEGETVNNRRLAVQRVRRLPLPPCHVVFVGQEEKEPGKILAGLRAGILTVGEGERFLRDGGMIAFVVDNRRVRFDVNQPAAAAAGLQISSKLLSVARNVEK